MYIHRLIIFMLFCTFIIPSMLIPFAPLYRYGWLLPAVLWVSVMCIIMYYFKQLERAQQQHRQLQNTVLQPKDEAHSSHHDK